MLIEPKAHALSDNDATVTGTMEVEKIEALADKILATVLRPALAAVLQEQQDRPEAVCRCCVARAIAAALAEALGEQSAPMLGTFDDVMNLMDFAMGSLRRHRIAATTAGTMPPLRAPQVSNVLEHLANAAGGAISITVVPMGGMTEEPSSGPTLAEAERQAATADLH